MELCRKYILIESINAAYFLLNAAYMHFLVEHNSYCSPVNLKYEHLEIAYKQRSGLKVSVVSSQVHVFGQHVSQLCKFKLHKSIFSCRSTDAKFGGSPQLCGAFSIWINVLFNWIKLCFHTTKLHHQ